MRPSTRVVFIAQLLAVLLASCSSDSGGRKIVIVQTDVGCTPESVPVTAGEKVTFVVKNNAKNDWELEGIEGAKIEEVLVPSGRSRSINYSVPSTAGTVKVKCYTPGGAATIIQLAISQ